MKTSRSNSSRQYQAAFTISELLTALAIFLVVVLGLVTLQILGLKMNALALSKMESTSSSLKILNRVRNQVLEASSVAVGNGSGQSFVATGTNGNALQVYPGTNTSNYFRYYVSTNDNTLYELNSTNSELTAIAPNITNTLVFQTVDFQGNTSSSVQEHYAIKMTLHFSQLAYKVPKKATEYYTFETEMTPRVQ